MHPFRRRALRRDFAQALIGLTLIALPLGFTQSRPFYFLVKSAFHDKITKANINGSTDLYLANGRLTDAESGKPVASIRWKASRQAIGKPPLLLWEGGAVEITGVTLHDASTTESQARAFANDRGLGLPLPNFVGARDITLDGQPARRMFPTEFTQSNHISRALPTFRATWPRASQLSLAALILLAAASLSFPRTIRSALRARRGRCLSCGYTLNELTTCPECNLPRQTS